MLEVCSSLCVGGAFLVLCWLCGAGCVLVVWFLLCVGGEVFIMFGDVNLIVCWWCSPCCVLVVPYLLCVADEVLFCVASVVLVVCVGCVFLIVCCLFFYIVC